MFQPKPGPNQVQTGSKPGARLVPRPGPDRVQIGSKASLVTSGEQEYNATYTDIPAEIFLYKFSIHILYINIKYIYIYK